MNNNIYNNSLRKQIVDKADIVAIIGSYVTLEKKGANYWGLCPFHDDKTASMSVSPSKKIFKCFSCNTAGDVITFVSKFKNISSRDAMREIGEQLGIKVQVTQKEIERQKNQKYYDIMQEASSFYSFYLTRADEAKKAREYLHNRGLKDDVISKFSIGLSSDNDEIYKLLSSKNYLPVDMLEVGIIRNGLNNSYRDTFRNRIMFPLKDLDGSVCGFSGRKYLEGDNDSKYVNTNETIIFKKGQILYNYSDAISSIKSKDKVFLFEGFMDVIASVRSGNDNSIASMGTALTNNQIEAIKRLTKNIVVCYDSDEPGINATLRAIELLIPYDMNISCVSIPDGKDPDEYIKKNGESALFDYLTNNQISAMDYVYKIFSRSLLVDDLNSKEMFKNNIFKYLRLFKSNFVVESILNKLSTDLSVSKEGLLDDFNFYSKNNIKVDNIVLPVDEIPPFIDEVEPNTKQVEFNKRKYIIAERQLIYAAYSDKTQCLEIDSKLHYNYVLDVHRDILYKLVEFYQIREMMNFEEFKTRLSSIELDTLNDIINNEKIDNFDYVSECINAVRQFPTINSIEQEKNNGKPKTLEDLESLAKMKIAVTRVNRKKGVK